MDLSTTAPERSSPAPSAFFHYATSHPGPWPRDHGDDELARTEYRLDLGTKLFRGDVRLECIHERLRLEAHDVEAITRHERPDTLAREGVRVSCVDAHAGKSAV